MNDETPVDNQEELLDDSQHRQSEEQPAEIAASPTGSQASQSSSSRRGPRVVELLPDVDSSESNRLENWVIGAEFYEEDVAANNQLSDDDASTDSELGDGIDIMDIYDAEDNDDDDGDIDGDNDIIDMGFVVAPANTSSDSSDDTEDEGANYDTTLPSSHRYLGEHMEESRGREVLVDSSTTKLYLFNFRHIILLPGQVLPLTTSNLNQRVYMCLKACISRGWILIGLMSDPAKNPIGTTAEIRNYLDDQEDELRIILEGRQRFRLMSQPFENIIEGTVRILPEISLGRPYLTNGSWRRFLPHQRETPRKYIVSKHPYWIVRKHESHYLVNRIRNHIKDWSTSDPTANTDDFSYWVAANLPISNKERMEVLQFECTEMRLLWLLDLLNKNEYLGCSACSNVICRKEDVLPMSCAGPQNSFVNSHGYVHDTLTVKNAEGLLHDNEWSEEFSWFPGYAWRIANCQSCNRHIGWCYKSIRPQVKPKKFYGLSRANVRLQSGVQDTVS